MASFNCTFSNAVDLPSTITWTTVEKAIILIFLPLVTFFGNVGNLAFLYTSWRIPRMHTAANMYLFSLALSDILFISTVCGLYIWIYLSTPVIRRDIYQSDIGCWLSFAVSILTYYASIQMVMLVSFERYYAICKPMKHLSFTGKQRTKKQIAICWIIALVLGIVGSLKYSNLQSITYCVGSIAGEKLTMPRYVTFKYCEAAFAHDWFTLISEILANGIFVAALIGSTFTYVKIIQALTNREDSNLQSNQNNTNSDVRRQVAIILMITGIIFFTSQTPYRFLGIYYIASDILKVWSLDYDKEAEFIVVCRICLYINSTINPYVYILGSKYYRQAFIEAFSFKRSKKENRSISLSAITNM